MSNEQIKITVDAIATEYRNEKPDLLYQKLTLSPDLLYAHARRLIPQLLHLDGTDRTAALMKVAIKGIFLAYGDKILEQIFKSKTYPKPQKGDDLVEWYIDLFTQILISQAMKQEYTVEVNETSEIVGCTARPVSETATANQ